LSGTSKLRNEYPTDSSTGVVTLSPLAGSQVVSEDDVKPENLLGDIASTNNNDTSEISEESGDNQESKGEDVLLSSNESKKGDIMASMMTNVASNNFSISSISSTETNEISNNISYDVDPVGKTRIIFVTKTNTVSGGNNVIATGGGDTYNLKVYKGHHKLSRLILAS